MNDRRKNTNWHITYKGHYMLPVPDADKLFYCHETGDDSGTAHTHIGFRARVAICKRDLLLYLRDHLEIDCEPDCKAHSNWRTIVGYHYGGGDKPACPDPVWVVEDGNPLDIHFPGRHRRAAKNAILLRVTPREAVDDGLIDLMRVKHLAEAQRLYHSFRPKARIELGERIPTTWNFDLKFVEGKLRHYWLFSSGSNAGKSTFCNQLVKTFACARTDNNFKWWRCDPGFQFVVLDAFRPAVAEGNLVKWLFPWGTMEQLCDGNYAFDIKCEPILLPDHHYVVVVACNLSPREAYGEEVISYVKTRFITYEIRDGELHDYFD